MNSHSSHLHKLLIVFTTLTIFAGLSAATTVSKNTDVSGDMGPGEEVQIYELQFDASQDSVVAGTAPSPATSLTDSADGDWAVRHIDSDGDTYWNSSTDTLYLDQDSDSAYTGETDDFITGSEPANGESVTAVGQDSDWNIDSIDNSDGDSWSSSSDTLLLDNDEDNAYTAQADNVLAGNSSMVNGTSLISVSDGDSLDGEWTRGANGDILYYDSSTGGGFDSGTDIIWVEQSGDSYYNSSEDTLLAGADSDGTQSSGNGLTSDWTNINVYDGTSGDDWGSTNDAIIEDFHNGGTYSGGPDIIVAGNTPSDGATGETYTSGEFDSDWGLDSVDANGDGGEWNSAEDAVIIDVGDRGTYSKSTDEVIAGQTPNDGDDTGAGFDADWSLDSYDADDGDGAWDGTQDAVIQDSDNNHYYGDQLTELDVVNTDGFSSSSATITVYNNDLSDSVGSTTGFGTISSLSASATDGTQTFYIAVDVPTDVAADQDDNTIAADVDNADTVSGSTLDANANSNSQIVNVPHITDTVTKDSDNSGGIDQVTIQFSEAVDISSTSGIDNLQLSNTNMDIANNDYSGQLGSSSVTVDLSSETSDTAGTTSTSYTNGGALTSDSGSYQITEAMTQLTETDGAAPVVGSAAYRDNDEDGTVDKVDVDFSEAVDYSPNTVSDDWNLAVNDLTGLSLDAKNSESSETVILDATATDITGVGTGTEPVIDISDTSTVTDTSGNNAETSSQVSLADEAAPVIDSGSTADYNTDGQVDAVDVVLTEPIDDSASTFDSGTFSTSDGDASVDGSSTGESSDDDSVEASISGAPSDDTAFTLSELTLSSGDISDGSNSIGSSYTLSTVSDGAAPVLVSTTYKDSQPDGTVDRLDTVFSESLSGTVDAADFTLSNGDAGDITKDTASINSDAVELTFSDAPVDDTGLSFDVDYTNNGDSLTDGNSNIAEGFSGEPAQDGAAPYAFNAQYRDTDTDGVVDRIDVNYTEDISGSSYTDSDWGIATAGTVNVAKDSSGEVSGSDVKVDVTGDSGTTGGSTAPEIEYTAGTSISDGSGNNAPGQVVTVSDSASPLADSVVTADGDDNGEIDQITVGYTESVESVVTGDYSLDSYSLGTADSSSGSSIVMNVQESGSYDTGATPALSYTGSGTTDGNGNGLVEVSASTADGADPVVADVDFSKDTVLDADRDQTVNVTYSETMNTGTTPTVSFNSVTSTGPSDTAWYDNMSTSDTFEAVYTLDDGQDVAGVDADVSGGEDDSSNTQVSSTSTSTFDVDTQEPVFDSQSATALAEGDIEVDWTLSTSDGDSFEIFKKNDTAEGGSYSLLSDSPSQPYPDSDTEHGVNYTYKVEATDDDGNSINSSEVEATSDSEGPSFSYTGPEGFQATDSPSITVDVSDEFHDVDEGTISVTVDSVETADVEIDSVGTGNGSVSYSGTTLTVDLSSTNGDEIDLAEGDVDVSVSADDSLGKSNSTTEASAFTVDTVAPGVGNVRISDNDDSDGVVADGDEVLVEFNASDDTSGVDTVSIDNSAFGGSEVAVTEDPEDSGSDYTATFNVDSTGDGDESVSVSATDVAGNGGSQNVDSNTLELDNTGLSISSANTNDLDNDGEIDQINVTLDEAIVDSDSTLNASTFDLDAGTVESVSTGDSADDDKLEIGVSGISDTSTTPDVTLATELSYVDLKDASGNTQTSNSSVIAIDSADPVLMYAEIDHQDSTDSNTRVNLEFSESVSDEGTDSDAVWINGEAFDLESTEASTQEVSYGSALQTGDSPLVNLSEEVTDASGNVAVNLSGENVEVDTFREQLDEGWNFVSFPVADHKTYEIDNVMDSSNVEVVWKYVDGEWKSSNTEFDTVEGGYGYLVKAEEAFTIDPNVNNIRETVNEKQEPTQSVDLSNGWNLVGQFQEFDQTADTSEAFGSLNSGDLGAVEAQASAGDLGLNRITDMDGSNAGEMVTGEAYWMWAKDSTSYTWY